MGCLVGWLASSSSSLSSSSSSSTTNLYSNMAEKLVVWSVFRRRFSPYSMAHTRAHFTCCTAILLQIDSNVVVVVSSFDRMGRKHTLNWTQLYGICVIFCSSTGMASMRTTYTMNGIYVRPLVFKSWEQMMFFFLCSKHQTISNYSHRLTNGSASSIFTLFFIFRFRLSND